MRSGTRVNHNICHSDREYILKKKGVSRKSDTVGFGPWRLKREDDECNEKRDKDEEQITGDVKREMKSIHELFGGWDEMKTKGDEKVKQGYDMKNRRKC